MSLIAIFSLAGCSTTTEDYADSQPAFDLKEFFDGELKGWGIVTDYRGKVTRRFTVDMNAVWKGDRGELYELFKYQDGTTQERTWYLQQRDNQINVGTASDVVGEAIGKENGFAFSWEYDLLIDTGDKNIQVHLNDWLYQIDSDSVLSQGKIKKFGLPVGEVIVFILKQEST